MKPASVGFSPLRFSNLLILIDLIVLTGTGVYGLFWSQTGWVFDLHRLTGWMLVLLIPWKVGISWRSLKRGLRWTFDRGVMIGVSLFLSVVSLLVIGLGIAWLWRIGPAEAWLRQTLVSWHWMLGLGLLAPLLLHVWRRWPKPKAVDFRSRRGVLKLVGLGAASLVTWGSAEVLAERIARATAPRRYTGSRQAESFSGNRFPITHAAGEGDQPVDIAAWILSVSTPNEAPRHWTYADLAAFPVSKKVATVDCTLGWYSHQVWHGIQLVDLLPSLGNPEPYSVVFESITGYRKTLPVREARQVLLATHVGDEVLDHWHGYPLRVVAPTRRGWYWVKWLGSIQLVTQTALLDWSEKWTTTTEKMEYRNG